MSNCKNYYYFNLNHRSGLMKELKTTTEVVVDILNYVKYLEKEADQVHELEARIDNLKKR